MLIALGGMAACSGNNDVKYDNGGGVIISPPPPPPAAKIEDSFGPRFAAAFRADPNSDPIDPVAGDISIPVDPTRDPLKLRP